MSEESYPVELVMFFARDVASERAASEQMDALCKALADAGHKPDYMQLRTSSPRSHKQALEEIANGPYFAPSKHIAKAALEGPGSDLPVD